MITAVIFDMDGVIADSEYFNVKAKHLILKKAGIEVDWHYHDKFLGTTHEYMWAEMKKEFESLDKEVPYETRNCMYYDVYHCSVTSSSIILRIWSMEQYYDFRI